MEPQPLDRIFVALADPSRRAMVEQLSRGPATVKQLAAPAKMGLPSAVKHLKVLEDGGIVISQKSGRSRTFRMRGEAFNTINAWVHEREAAMNAGFDRLIQAMNEFPEEKRKP